MNFAPLVAAPVPVVIHVATVVPAFVLGTWLIFFSRKGARFHRLVGYIYLGLMTVTAIDALFVQQINRGGPFFGLSPVHLFVPLTLLGVAGALWGARAHDVKMHKRSMLGVYIGGLLIAGGFAFAPGRIMHAVVFGG